MMITHKRNGSKNGHQLQRRSLVRTTVFGIKANPLRGPMAGAKSSGITVPPNQGNTVKVGHLRIPDRDTSEVTDSDFSCSH
jgi:hypothetical protein